MAKESKASAAEPLHIGMVLPSLTGGGAERMTLTLAGSLMARGHRVDILVGRFIVAYPDELLAGLRLFRPGLWPLGKTARRCRARGVAVRNLDIVPSLRDWRALASVRRRALVGAKHALFASAIAQYVRAERPGLLLAGVEDAQTAALCAAQLEGCAPVTVVVHGGDGPLCGERLALAQLLYPRAAALFAVSRQLGAHVERSLHFASGTVKAIDIPVAAAKVQRLANERVDHPWFAATAPPVMVAVCRAGSPYKDPGTVVAALALVCRDMPARLALVGRLDDRARRELVRQAQTLGVADAVTFIDFDPNPFRYMRRAAMVVVSSYSEGMPAVLIEAMACGTPVVSTDTPYGPAEILCAGKFGKLVPMGAPEPMAQAMLATLRGDRPTREALQRRAQHFSCERAAQRYESAFVEIVRARRSAADDHRQSGASATAGAP